MPHTAPTERTDATQPTVTRIDVGGARSQQRTLRTRRVGATRRADVAPTVVALLEAGAMQSATHVEEMVLDMASLASRVFPFVELDREQVAAAPFVQRMRFSLMWSRSPNATPTTGCGSRTPCGGGARWLSQLIQARLSMWWSQRWFHTRTIRISRYGNGRGSRCAHV